MPASSFVCRAQGHMWPHTVVIGEGRPRGRKAPTPDPHRYTGSSCHGANWNWPPCSSGTSPPLACREKWKKGALLWPEVSQAACPIMHEQPLKSKLHFSWFSWVRNLYPPILVPEEPWAELNLDSWAHWQGAERHQRGWAGQEGLVVPWFPHKYLLRNTS